MQWPSSGRASLTMSAWGMLNQLAVSFPLLPFLFNTAQEINYGLTNYVLTNLLSTVISTQKSSLSFQQIS